ncbi:hypothetical protein GLIP_2795 [Aliiglaciecola lipolytica E3]|uniref:Uncharacterized protein n=1 Tax=Aliiglaciecola lipolytica E3 TaxID=1127673 RepID=K6XUS6_9ALTE|nr:hypothetical protein GLIP_2795 [Aliiglaciecola lipolytica E3]
MDFKQTGDSEAGIRAYKRQLKDLINNLPILSNSGNLLIKYT